MSAATLLRLRDFRFLSLAALANSIGMTGEQVVVGWLTLELTDSPLMVGVALGARMVPHLFIGIPAGVLADRVERNHLLQATGIAMASLNAVVGILAIAGVVRVWELLLLTVAAGCVRAVHQAARQGYAHDLVGPRDLVNGLALLGIAMRVGGLVGSLLTGTLIARAGSGTAYLAVAAGYLVSVMALWPARPDRREGAAPTGTVREGLWAFLSDLHRDPRLSGLVGLTAAAEVFGYSHQALLPSLARDVLEVGPEGLGAMTAARSVGGILGILAVSRVGGTFTLGGAGTLYLGNLFVFGGSLIALAFSGTFAWVLVVLVLVNAVGALSDILSQALIQLTVPHGLHGRAGGAWVVAIGAAPLGQLQIGALASALGVGAAIGVSGIAMMGVVAAAAFFVPRLRSL